jgi:hypothetical protein
LSHIVLTRAHSPYKKAIADHGLRLALSQPLDTPIVTPPVLFFLFFFSCIATPHPPLLLKIKRLAARLKPLALGLAFCGAGGGGFLAVLCKEPCFPGNPTWLALEAAIVEAAAEAGADAVGTVHKATLALGGMLVDIDL